MSNLHKIILSYDKMHKDLFELYCVECMDSINCTLCDYSIQKFLPVRAMTFEATLYFNSPLQSYRFGYGWALRQQQFRTTLGELAEEGRIK